MKQRNALGVGNPLVEKPEHTVCWACQKTDWDPEARATYFLRETEALRKEAEDINHSFDHNNPWIAAYNHCKIKTLGVRTERLRELRTMIDPPRPPNKEDR